jgi:hypothetical protein
MQKPELKVEWQLSHSVLVFGAQGLETRNHCTGEGQQQFNSQSTISRELRVSCVHVV